LHYSRVFRMKKLRDLNEVVREYNGLLARYKKNQDGENQALLDACLQRLKVEADKVLG